jgi:D-lactate dehydrogenase (cytochrome)
METHHGLLVSPEGDVQATVFYFPGCGSERLHSDIALAALYLLVSSGVRVVLPPPYLCCGFPARANAKTDLGNRQELNNTILFTQIRSMLGAVSFDACVITCGTCRESLVRMDAARIFEAPLLDAAGFVLDRGWSTPLLRPVLYHQPCHDSLEGRGVELLGQLTEQEVKTVPHCCGEAGTLALSRPDIAAAMLERKREALVRNLNQASEPLWVTHCPACLNGLGRLGPLSPIHLTTVLAEARDRENWRRIAARHLAQGERIGF